MCFFFPKGEDGETETRRKLSLKRTGALKSPHSQPKTCTVYSRQRGGLTEMRSTAWRRYRLSVWYPKYTAVCIFALELQPLVDSLICCSHFLSKNAPNLPVSWFSNWIWHFSWSYIKSLCNVLGHYVGYFSLLYDVLYIVSFSLFIVVKPDKSLFFSLV